MKKNLILAAVAASTLAVGLSACGTASTPTAQPEAQPEAQPFPRESPCADIQRPADPRGFIGNHWFTDDACNIFNVTRPGAGVDADQADAIVYDARMKLMFGKRDIAMLAVEANKQADHGVKTDFAGIIAARYSTVKGEVDAARAALDGHAPEGYHLDFMKNEVPSASPGLTPKK